MASEMGWGGVPLMRPSNLATRYQLYERDIIPERCIETGQRYRARRNLVEHVRGFRIIKRSLQRRLADIEHERKMAHHEEPYMDRVKKWTIYYRDFTGSGGELPRPTGTSIHCCDRNTRSSRPLLLTDRCITLLSQPRAEEFLGLVDIRKRMIKNPSEAMKKD